MESRLTQSELYYLLGFGFSDFVKTEHLVISKKRVDYPILKEFSYRLYNQDRVARGRDGASLVIDEPAAEKFLSEAGTLTPKKYVPAMLPSLKPAFAAGYFDSRGEFTFNGSTPRMFVKVVNSNVGDFLAEQWKVEPTDKVVVSGYKALDVMGVLAAHTPYESSGISLFWNVLNHHTDSGDVKGRKFYYHKLSPKAVPPQKERVTDSGYDLHVVELTKLYTTYFGAEVYKGKTELAVKPVMGQAFDIAGRSSLPDKGWQFLQGVGICDRSYTGGIAATLMKLSSDPLPEFPWKCLQLVPRPSPIHLPFEERRDLGESDRGHGGFGSTDRKTK